MIITVDAGKALDKIQQPFFHKNTHPIMHRGKLEKNSS